MPLREDLSNGKLRFGTWDGGANKFLAPLLDKLKDKTTFPFFELPAELRNCIYEYLFQYPRSGVRIGGSTLDSRRLTVLSRSSGDRFERNDWKHSQYDAGHTTWLLSKSMTVLRLLRTKIIAEILSPLLVNSQFFRKAVPIFYEVNQFHFKRADEVESALRSLALHRRRHFAHISFEHPCNSAGLRDANGIS